MTPPPLPSPVLARSVATKHSSWRTSLALLLALLAPALRAQDFLDRLDDSLSFATPGAAARARLSGTFDLEGYRLPSPAPALFDTTRTSLLNPRLTLFLDAQLGPHAYVFAQARADHGFDPGDGPARRRLDEYALRLTPWSDGRVSLQLGKFSTIVGNWVNRHGSWENPFVTAPLPYENLTGIWDTEAARSLGQLLLWSHVRPGLAAANLANEKHLRVPLLWGPAYTTGLAVSGALGKFRYAAELKNAPLSSRPTSWTKAQKWWSYPATSARLGWVPSPMWDFGVSASTGVYLRPSATRTLAPGTGRGDYRQRTLAADAAFAWHHWQVWAELFRTRFAIPTVGEAGVLAGYVEAKYKFTPQLAASVRWNRQAYATIPDAAGVPVHWGRDLTRLDFAPAWRFTAHTQLKLQYSLQREPAAARSLTHFLAAQFTIRF